MAPPAATTPPEISAPKLVTSTNPATGSSMNPNKEEEDWHSKYLEAKFTCKKLRAQLKDQAKKSRQLIVAVKTKLQDEEVEKIKLKDHYDTELSNLCQQLLSVQALVLREQNRVETLLREKDQAIGKQKHEIDKLRTDHSQQQQQQQHQPPPLQQHQQQQLSQKVASAVSVTSLSNLSPVTLGGSLRIHGSFRQYKKDREKIRQHLKSSTVTTLINDNSGSSSSSSSGININSSEDSSSSPSTLPRAQKSNLRQSFSSSLIEELPKKTKGILKPSASMDTHGEPKTILENLQQLIDPSQTSASATKIRIQSVQDNPDPDHRIQPEDRSDSGRESDDVIEQVPNVSVVTVSTDSANSSFDANDPTLAWKIQIQKEDSNETDQHSIQSLKKKVKPAPPPRSSHTKLSTVILSQSKPKSILSPTSSLNPEMSPTEALDHLIHNIDNNCNRLRTYSEKKKRVKFNPKVDTSRAPEVDFEDPPKIQVQGSTRENKTTQGDSTIRSKATQPLDPNFLHFLPRLNQKQDMIKNSNNHNTTNATNTTNNNNNDESKKRNFSYYEPYI